MAAAKIKLAALGTGIYYIYTKLGSGSSNDNSYPPTLYYRAQHENPYAQINAGPPPSDIASSSAPPQHHGEGYLPINTKQ